jgi:hypothetical protein
MAFIEHRKDGSFPVHYAAKHTDNEHALRFLIELNPAPVLPLLKENSSTPLRWMLRHCFEVTTPSSLPCLRALLALEGSKEMMSISDPCNKGESPLFAFCRLYYQGLCQGSDCIEALRLL